MSSESATRVLIVDDHAVFLEGLKTILNLETSGDIRVVGTASNGTEALELEKQLEPDVVLLDIKMPGMDGVEVARVLRSRRREIKIIMLTTFDDRELIAGALDAGADGYLLKDVDSEQILQAVRSAARGNVLISGDLAQRLTNARAAPRATTSTDDVVPEDLTHRELQILLRLARGMKNREIGEALDISEKTVRNYITRIYDVLGVDSRTKAVIWAFANLPELKE
jgi:DNA-binding NarL/FixJ family response regulator